MSNEQNEKKVEEADASPLPLSKEEVSKRIGELPSKSKKQDQLQGMKLEDLFRLLAMSNSIPNPDDVCNHYHQISN